MDDPTRSPRRDASERIHGPGNGVQLANTSDEMSAITARLSSQEASRTVGTSVCSGPILLLLVGLPGSGKTTFAEALVPHGWVRASQDDSVSGRRQEVERVVLRALEEGKNVVVDRVNFDVEQRAHFIHLARSLPLTRIYCLVLMAPEPILRSRLSTRIGHPTLKDADTALSVLERMKRAYVPPQPGEGFDKVLILREEWSVQDVLGIMERIEMEGRSDGDLRSAGREGGVWRGRGRGRGRGYSGRGRGAGTGARGRGGPPYDRYRGPPPWHQQPYRQDQYRQDQYRQEQYQPIQQPYRYPQYPPQQHPTQQEYHAYTAYPTQPPQRPSWD